MPSTSQKHQNFMAGPMGDKKVTEIPGIDQALGKTLEEAGFDKAYHVLAQYLLLNKNQELFQLWMNDTFNASAKECQDCHQGLSDWCEEFLDGGRGVKKERAKINANRSAPSSTNYHGSGLCISIKVKNMAEEESEEEDEIEEEEGESEEGDRVVERDYGQEKERGEEGRKGEGNWQIAFWNVAGVMNKNEEFWKKIEKWEVIVLIDTLLEDKNWEEISCKLPKGYRWTRQEPTRIPTRGKRKGGMMIGARAEMVEDQEEDRRVEGEGLMTRKIKVGEETWTVVGVSVDGDMERKLKMLRGLMEEEDQERKVIIGGDFNARTGETGGRAEVGRRSKDKTVNAEGRKLTRVLEEVGWQILNGNVKGDEEGKYTFTKGKMKAVKDYVLGDENTREGIEELVIGDRMSSEHHPVIVTMKKGVTVRRSGKEDEGTKREWQLVESDERENPKRSKPNEDEGGSDLEASVEYIGEVEECDESE